MGFESVRTRICQDLDLTGFELLASLVDGLEYAWSPGCLVTWLLGYLDAWRLAWRLLPLMLASLADSLLGCWLACWIALLFGYGWLSLAWLLRICMDCLDITWLD